MEGVCTAPHFWNRPKDIEGLTLLRDQLYTLIEPYDDLRQKSELLRLFIGSEKHGPQFVALQ